jgi:hypothetical protein
MNIPWQITITKLDQSSLMGTANLLVTLVMLVTVGSCDFDGDLERRHPISAKRAHPTLQ